MNSEFRKLFLCLQVAIFAVFLCLVSCVNPVLAGSSSASLDRCRVVQSDLDFLAGFPFAILPWPASLETNNLIKVTTKKEPQWKTLWDQARGQAVSRDLRLASDTFRQTLQLKPGLDEAKWELANILFVTGKYQEAREIIESLVGRDPERLDYLNALAVLDLKNGKYLLAADLFAGLYKKNADINTLAGAVYGYLKAKRPKEALPLLVKLANVAGDVPGLRQFLGHLAYEQGDYETAAIQFKLLANGDSSPSHTIVVVPLQFDLCAARSLEKNDESSKAVKYWQNVLVAKPDMLEAHKRLADFYEKNGQVEQALPHLLFLYKHETGAVSLLKRLGRCYLGLKEFPQALSYFQKYLLKKPRDIESARLVVSLQAASGDKAGTLSSLEHYFEIESHPDKANLEKAAKLYGEKGLYRQALVLWQKLLALTPDNPEILGAMAQNFLAIGKDREALKVWKKLAGISPNIVEVYRPMAVLLERMGRQQELIEVLESLHDLRPMEQDVTLKLAILYVRNRADEKAFELFKLLDAAHCQENDFFYWRAVWAENQNDLSLALQEFQKFLQAVPNSYDVELRCLIIAGRLGRLKLVRRYFDDLSGYISSSATYDHSRTADLQFKAALAFKNCGAYDEAVNLLKGLINEPELLSKNGRAAIDLADIFKAKGELYEAEQYLRIGLAAGYNRQEILVKLFNYSFTAGDISQAEAWYELLRHENAVVPRPLMFLKAKLRFLQGKKYQAVNIARSLSQLLRKLEIDKPDKDWLRENLDLAFFLKGLDNVLATDICRHVLHKYPPNLRAKVLLASLGKTSRSCMLSDLAGLNMADLLEYARWALKNNQPWLVERSAKLAIAKTPDSLMARILLAQSATMLGKPGILEIWGKLAAANPTNSFIVLRAAKAAFLAGNLARSMALCRSLPHPDPEILLLTGRILWMQNKWPDALKTYKKITDPPVVSLLRQAAIDLDVQLPVPTQKKSFWQSMSLLPISSPLADLLMSPESFVGSTLSSKAGVFQLKTARLFALYRWQERFATELLARKSIQERAYFMAQRRYEALVAQYPAEKSLMFDLAGIYGQLGSLDEEAAIYDKLQADGVKFPSLVNDMRRNKLKRQPSGTIAYNYWEEEGRNDFKDMRITSQNVAFRLFPRTGEEFKINLDRNNYHGVNADGSLHSAKIMASYKVKVMNRFLVNLGGGVESLDSRGMNTALFDVNVIGKLGDKLTAKVLLRQDVVADTIVSLNRGIYKRDIGAGLSFEPLSRLALGGDYNHLKYSDDNWTTNYDFWSSFLVHSEPYFLQLKYKYEFKDSADGSGNEQIFSEALASGAHPYWSPKNYWASQVGVYFKHILSYEHLNSDISKYYTLQYYLGHDTDGYGFQRVKSSFCMDFNPHFIMRAEAELFSSAVYRKKQFSLSASYRW